MTVCIGSGRLPHTGERGQWKSHTTRYAGPENCRELGYRRVYRVFPTRPQQIASGIRRYVRTYVLFFLSSKTKETCSVMSTACKPDGCHIIIVVYELVCQRHSKRGYSIHTMCVILGAQDLGTLRGV